MNLIRVSKNGCFNGCPLDRFNVVVNLCEIDVEHLSKGGILLIRSNSLKYTNPNDSRFWKIVRESECVYRRKFIAFSCPKSIIEKLIKQKAK